MVVVNHTPIQSDVSEILEINAPLTLLLLLPPPPDCYTPSRLSLVSNRLHVLCVDRIE